jgi:hypothetical protein
VSPLPPHHELTTHGQNEYTLAVAVCRSFFQPEKRSGELEESGGLEDDGSFNVVAMRVDVRAGLFYGWVVSTEG